MSRKCAGPRAGVEKFSSDGEKIFVTTTGFVYQKLEKRGHVAELVYAYASGAYGSNPLRVQVPLCPLVKKIKYRAVVYR